MDSSERMKQLAEAVKKVRGGNAFQVPMGTQAAKAMLEKHLRPPSELEIANRLDDDGDQQAASVIRRQHAELTRLRDFARSVREAPTAALAFNNGVDDVVMKPNKHIRSEYVQRSTELIARPARVEV